MQAIIIDDDVIEMELFINNINWELLGIDLVGCAENGITGLELYQKFHPDLIITDIEMPGMNGIELAQKIRETDLECKIVYLTSYEKFEYAHSGFELDVSEYILKQDLFVKDHTAKLLKVINDYLFKNRSSIEITENLIRQLIFSGDKERMEAEQYQNLLSNQFYCFLIVERSPIPILQNIMEGILPKVIDYKDLKNVFQNDIPIYFVPSEYGGYLSLIHKNNIRETGNWYDRVLLKCKEKLHSDFQIITLMTKGSVVDLKGIYQKYKHRFILRYFYDENVISLNDLNTAATEHNSIDEAQLADMEQDLHYEQLEAYLDTLYNGILENKDYNGCNDFIYALYLHLLQCSKNMIDLDKETVWRVIEPLDIQNTYSFNKVYCLLKNKYHEYFQFIKKKKILQYSDYVQQALHIVFKSYSDPNLSAETIVEKVNISESRLRTVFKNDMGISLQQYITQLRIRKAKKLLLTSSDTMNQIAQQVGYISGKYFSRVFTKETEITPEEFRIRGR